MPNGGGPMDQSLRAPDNIERTNPVLEQVRTLAVSLGLVVLYQEATPERGHVLSLYYGKTCLHRTSDLSTVEFYLYGFRDGASLPNSEAAQALENVRIVRNELLDAVNAQHKLLTRLDEVGDFLDPLTREGR